MNTNTNECVYYWVGGSEAGQWREAAPNRWTPEAERPIDAFERAIQRQGYVTVRGSTLIGPPDGPPSRERLAAAVAVANRAALARGENPPLVPICP